MGDFIKKHGSTIGWFAWVGTLVSVGAGYVISMIRNDKRQVDAHKKLNEVYQAEIDMLRGENKKES